MNSSKDLSSKTLLDGTAMRSARKRKGLTLDDVSELLRLKMDSSATKGMVSRWENEIVMPRMETIIFLAEILEVDLIEILNLGVKTDVGDLCSKGVVTYYGRELSVEEIEKVDAMLKVLLD